MRFRVQVLLLLACFTRGIDALEQPLTIGPGLVGASNVIIGDISFPAETFIDLSAPAASSGAIVSATFAWSRPACTVKIKFFHRNGDALTFFEERGPFQSVEGIQTVALSPAVNVGQGDLIGITRASRCDGSVRGFFNETAIFRFAHYTSDVGGAVNISGDAEGYAWLALGGTSTTEPVNDVFAGTLPVVGTTAGSGGSFFRTSLQLLNPSPFLGTTIRGRMVFHPAGRSGSFETDPSLSYTLPPKEVRSYPDIVAAFGVSGLGSIDFLVPTGGTLPIVSTRVFNDAGAAGTSGLSEPLIEDLGDFIFGEARGYLVTPIDPTKTRFNIGIRTFEASVVTFSLYDSSGNLLATNTRSYQPLFFEQAAASVFVGTTISGNQTIEINSSGTLLGVIVYGSTTDNTTNDPAMQLARVYRP